MSLKIVLLLLGAAGAAGIVIGYFLRMLLLQAKRGSMELQIRRMMLDADERAKKIVEEAERRGEERAQQIAAEAKERERDLKQVEERLLRREELLDKRQTNLDTEMETIARKNEEILTTKEKADEILRTRQESLEKMADLSADQAKHELIRSVEKQYETDLEGRMRKLEISSNERLEQKAKEIMT
ncbi:MAG TPA: Rnase Y domain-containing protein, partial [Candidatus Paceibacterota bacterium]|nr:Rnase Y domain-containing protein [Candidatus Paceibacterota bacterium]